MANEFQIVRMTVRPYIERGGYRLDRFEACVDDWLVMVSREPLYDGARVLLDCGYVPEMLLTMRHDGEDHDSFEPRSLGEICQRSRRATGRGTAAPEVEALRCPALSGRASPAGDDQVAAE